MNKCWVPTSEYMSSGNSCAHLSVWPKETDMAQNHWTELFLFWGLPVLPAVLWLSLMMASVPPEVDGTSWMSWDFRSMCGEEGKGGKWDQGWGPHLQRAASLSLKTVQPWAAGSAWLRSELEGAIAFAPVLSWGVSWKAEARLLRLHGLDIP